MTDEPVIILADDLAPSETVQLEKDKVLSFVTVHGSVNSHTAILARTMGIPALVSTEMELTQDLDGKLAVVDGNHGTIYVDPDAETMEKMETLKKEEEEKKELLQTFKNKESITLDGKKVLTYANIGNVKDLALVLQNGAEGIGLFRSEFLYLESETYPTEEEQFEVYKKVAETMAGKRVIIRTLDIGADKQADYFELAKEENASCTFEVMDAENPDFPDGTFDVIVSRNLTWTLPDAARAYKEWIRVLKTGGILINADANYGADDFSDTADLPANHAHFTVGDAMMQECEEIKRQLPISSYVRPAWDLETLGKLGINRFSIDLGISSRIYTKKDEFYNPTPMFLICGEKNKCNN